VADRDIGDPKGGRPLTPRAVIMLIATALTIALAGGAAPAGATTPAVTTQAQAANAAFLAYAPSPAAGPGGLCLVDTGVSPNPDTQAGLVSASALDGGSGNDVDPDGHGTTMAMIAGAAGHGMIGAWPQIKIVSVRATDAPTPGQEPSFEFSDYAAAIARCSTLASQNHIHAIDLALSSAIPPSPDQAQAFANQVGVAQNQNIAVLAAAGNSPGAVEEPAAEPGVLAVGAGDPNNGVCSFSATQGLTFYAPGCGLNMADPVTDQPTCCGNGTSQASAFAAAVLVALMSYDPTLTYSKAEQLLVSTAADGHLNATAAFAADGLGAIVAAGNANIPEPAEPASSATTAPPPSAKPTTTAFAVREARWTKNRLTLVVTGLGNDRLRIEVKCPGRPRRVVSSARARTVIHTARPSGVVVRAYSGKRLSHGPISVRLT
jgi:Subtilase family